jgi:MtN3 and saliva related transmembrane protein
MELSGLIGGAASCASVVSFVPQAIKIAKTRDTSAISAKMYGVTIVGFVLWTAYGVVIVAYPIIVANSLCLFLSSFILAMKVAPRSRRDRIRRRR